MCYLVVKWCEKMFPHFPVSYPPCPWCVVFQDDRAAPQSPEQRQRLHTRSRLQGMTSAPPAARNSDPAARTPGTAWPWQRNAGTKQRPDRLRQRGGGGRRSPCPEGLQQTNRHQKPNESTSTSRSLNSAADF